MNSLERILTALKRGRPDRPPTMEMVIDPHVIHGIVPGLSYADFIEYADMDAVTCLTMADDPARIPWVDKERHIWLDKWGARQQLTEDVISMVVEPARIESSEDLAAYDPPNPNEAAVHDYAKKLVDRFKGKKAIAVIGECSFAPSQYLRAGLSNLMLDYAERPDFVKKLARIGVDYHVELYRKLIVNGVEIVVLGDGYAGKTGPFMSPRHFAEYIFPCIKTIAQAVHDAGGYCCHHTDGDIWPIMDLLIEAGLDMLGPLEPAYMRLDEVRRYRGGAIGAMGNIDVDLLSRGTVAQVQAATRELLARVAPLGGHILSSGNTISSYVKPENFMAMLTTAKEWGRG
ncbi:MAG: hypothetical protein IT578_07305 [Verrucomicrobiae bacterium]|nr:hypothetical protein [Verrucomicrobiae bacterium]